MDVDLPPSLDGTAFAIYRQNSAPVCAITLPEGDKASDFWFKSTVYQLPNAVLFRAASAAHVMHRGADEIALGHRQIMLTAMIQGEVDSVVDGRRRSIRAGDVAFFDHARGYHSTAKAYAIIAIFADRDRLPPVFRLPAAHGAVLPAAGGAARLLHRNLAALLEMAGELSLAAANSGIDGVFGVAATALTESLSRERAQAYGAEAALIEKALAFVDENLADTNLTPLRIGQHLGTSRSGLYRLFEPLGGVRGVVLQRRLDRAVRTLLSEHAPRPPWRKIAAEHGFGSEVHFSRAFRAQFGVTPRAFHDMVRRQDKSGLLAQAWRAGYLSSQAWVEYLADQDDPAQTPGAAPVDPA
jgi:AraC-like DNA-binding protein